MLLFNSCPLYKVNFPLWIIFFGFAQHRLWPLSIKAVHNHGNSAPYIVYILTGDILYPPLDMYILYSWVRKESILTSIGVRRILYTIRFICMAKSIPLFQPTHVLYAYSISTKRARARRWKHSSVTSRRWWLKRSFFSFFFYLFFLPLHFVWLGRCRTVTSSYAAWMQHWWEMLDVYKSKSISNTGAALVNVDLFGRLVCCIYRVSLMRFGGWS